MADKSITDKEWLDLAWKYFQQHAQQRISYFNFFIIFSTILTTAWLGTFQSNYDAPLLGIGIGTVQIFIAFIFLKIDLRNRFLTKHAENIIMLIEGDYFSNNVDKSLFLSEDIRTNELLTSKKNVFFLSKPFTHGKSYRIIYIFFTVLGIIGVGFSYYDFQFYNSGNKNATKNNVNIDLKLNQSKIILGDSTSKPTKWMYPLINN